MLIQAIETAVLDSIRRIGTDPKLAEAVAESPRSDGAPPPGSRPGVDNHRRSLRQSNQALAREAGGPAAPLQTITLRIAHRARRARVSIHLGVTHAIPNVTGVIIASGVVSTGVQVVLMLLIRYEISKASEESVRSYGSASAP